MKVIVKDGAALDRIAAALNNANIGSTELQELILEAEAETEAASNDLAAKKEKASDVCAEEDIATASQAVTTAEVRLSRYKNALPRLRDKLTAVLDREYLERWNSHYEKTKIVVDQAAEEYKTDVQKAFDILVAALAREETVAAEVDRVNLSAPPGVGKHLRRPELIARNLASFSATQPSLAKRLVIPFFDRSELDLWPPRQQIDPAIFAPVAVPQDEINGNWWKVRAEKEEKAKQTTLRRIAEEEARLQQSKRDFETRKVG